MARDYGLIVHPEDFDYFLKDATTEEAGELIRNMIRAFQGNTEEIKVFDDRFMKVASEKICGRIIRERELSIKRSQAGAMGGAPVDNQNNKSSKSQAKVKQKSSKAQAKVKPNITNNTNITNIPIKNIYGTAQNVLLSDEELSKVKAKGYEDLIEELSLYMASKNKKYADHYMTILAWGRKRDKEKDNAKVIKPNQFTAGIMKSDYDYAALEAKIVKNY